MFIIPGDSIFIDESDKLYYQGGESALINTYHSDWEEYISPIFDTASEKHYYSQNPDDFLLSVDLWAEIWRKPFVQLVEKNPNINKEFQRLEKARIKYSLYSDINNYKKCHKGYTGQNPAIPSHFYDYLKGENFNDTTLMQIGSYMYFLISYVQLQSSKKEPYKNGFFETSNMLDIIETTFLEQSITDEVSKEIMRHQTSQLKVNDTILERFEKICTNQGYLASIKDSYNEFKPLLAGNMAPDFELSDTEGNKRKLDDFSGKYLLIDVWSTTCSPCIREFPNLEKLKHEFEGKNIEIISACMSNEQAWKKMLFNFNLRDDQYIIENGWNSQFRHDYLKSSGVPVYIFIDPDGKIINARAPKPSENLRDVINKYVI